MDPFNRALPYKIQGHHHGVDFKSTQNTVDFHPLSFSLHVNVFLILAIISSTIWLVKLLVIAVVVICSVAGNVSNTAHLLSNIRSGEQNRDSVMQFAIAKLKEEKLTKRILPFKMFYHIHPLLHLH